MGLNKKSKTSNEIGNLYRAALFLARGQGEEKLGLALLKKAAKELNRQRLKTLLKRYPQVPTNPKNRLILAEKILDEYLLLK